MSKAVNFLETKTSNNGWFMLFLLKKVFWTFESLS